MACKNRSMIFPRYSLRVILLVTALCAVLSLIVSLGVQGKPWAAGMSIGLLALVVTLALGGLAFALIWAFTTLLGRIGSRHEPSLHAERAADAARAKPAPRNS